MEKLFLYFHAWFHDADHLLHYRQMSIFSLLSVSKKRGIQRIAAVSFFYKWQKFNKNNEKRSLWYHSVGAEYVTEQIYSLVMQLLLRRFYR